MIEFFPIDKTKFYLPPVRGTQGSVGYDLFVSDRTVIPHSKVGTVDLAGQGIGCLNRPTLVKTNTGVALPPGCWGLLKERSSMGKRGIMCLAGVIDNDYRGELVICVVNFGDEFVIEAGERLAQLIVSQCWFGDDSNMRVISTGERGSNGFGSTGA